MEQRLIELDKVLELIETCNSDGLTGIFCSYQDGKRFEQLLIKHIPIVEPIKGEWIKQTLAMPLSDSTKDCVMCSNCKTHWDMDCKFNFCPNCGADMRGGKE